MPENHPVQVVNEVVVYAYLRNIYSSRKMEQAVLKNVHFMWMAGGAKPDHNTINEFRRKRLKGQLKDIFNRVVVRLAEAGAVTLKEVVLDGTKIEANVNRYTFVWGKAIRVSRERIEKQLRELWVGRRGGDHRQKRKPADCQNQSGQHLPVR